MAWDPGTLRASWEEEVRPQWSPSFSSAEHLPCAGLGGARTRGGTGPAGRLVFYGKKGPSAKSQGGAGGQVISPLQWQVPAM